MIDLQEPHMVKDLQAVMNNGFEFDGHFDSPHLGGYSYPPQNVEHPLKGLLKDKGCEAAITYSTKLYEHYRAVAKHLCKMVQKRNEAAGGGYLFLSVYTNVKFRWRSNRQLDRLTGFTDRANRMNFFSREYPHYEEFHALLKDLDLEAYQYYRAIDAVRSDVEVRLRISYAVMQEYVRAQDAILNFEERLRLSESRQVTAILEELNDRIKHGVGC